MTIYQICVCGPRAKQQPSSLARTLNPVEDRYGELTLSSTCINGLSELV